MLRDRLPKIVDLALRYCKCKNLWLDHVYYNFVGIYIHKVDRDNAVRKCIKDIKNKNMGFRTTIMWDNMEQADKDAWDNVCLWVEYFQKNYQVAENEVNIAKTTNPGIWYQDVEKLVAKALPSQADNYNLIRYIALSLTTK